MESVQLSPDSATFSPKLREMLIERLGNRPANQAGWLWKKCREATDYLDDELTLSRREVEEIMPMLGSDPASSPFGVLYVKLADHFNFANM